MSLEALKRDLPSVLAKIDALSQPIGKLPAAHWEQNLALQTSTDIGPIDVDAGLDAEAHVTRQATAPLTTNGFVGDAEEEELAWVSLVLAGKANAKYAAKETVGTGATAEIGFSAGASARLAHHRRVEQDQPALGALLGLATDLRLPFSAQAAMSLEASDVLEVDLGGTVGLYAGIGWKAGLLHEVSLDDLGEIVGDVGVPLAIQAGVTAALKVMFQLSGDLRLVVRPGATGRVLLSLHKRGNQFAGGELKVGAAVNLENAEKFVDGFLAQALELPDGWRDRLAQIHDELGELLQQVDGWQRQVRNEIDKAIPDGEMTIESLLRLLAGDRLGASARAELGSLQLDEVGQRLGEVEAILQKLADRAFDVVGEPIRKLHEDIGSWIDGYEKLRDKVGEFLKSKVQQGLELELKAGINRTRSTEAILELEFELAIGKAAAAYESAVRGNFEQALQMASADGANGVEIHSGSLKRTLKQHRYTSFKLNLFGFQVKRDLAKFRSLTFEEDLETGTLTVLGTAGATMSTERGQQLRSLSVGFDLATVAQRHLGQLSFGELGISAVIGRSAQLDGKVADKAIPAHVRGAVALGALDEEQAEALARDLLAQSGKYEYELEINLSAEAVQRAFLLDSSLSSKQLVPHLRRVFRTAVSFFDVVLDATPGDVLLSRMLTEELFDEVANRPQLSEWKHFHPSLGRTTFPNSSRFALWTYLLHAQDFIGAYLAARDKLLQDRPPKEVAKVLMRLSAAIRQTQGFGEVVPMDSKYLAFVLLGQASYEDVRLTFKRGTVEVTV